MDLNTDENMQAIKKKKQKEVIWLEKQQSKNDQRSDALNPTSAEHKAALDNRSDQMNQNNPAYNKSRGKK